MLLHRFFSTPTIKPGATEPFREQVDSNEAGQRISDMMVHGDSLYVATASKSGLEAALPYGIRQHMVGDEYGGVYQIRMSGALSVGLPAENEVTVRVRLKPDTVELELDGDLLGRTNVSGRQLGCIDRITMSEGTFGTLIGPAVEAVVRVNRLACPR